MLVYFADTFYFIAMLNPRDQHHHQAMAIEAKTPLLVTTSFVLMEVADAMSDERNRIVFVEYMKALRTQPGNDIVNYT
jgi:hypothetical protein